MIYIILGILYGLFDRLRELTHFDSWLLKWLNFWNIDIDSFWGKWWRSWDKDEFKKWHNYFWRDAYHTFKNLCVLLFLIALILDGNHLDLFYAFISFGIVQIVFNWWIKA